MEQYIMHSGLGIVSLKGTQTVIQYWIVIRLPFVLSYFYEMVKKIHSLYMYKHSENRFKYCQQL